MLFDRDRAALEAATERTIALNPFHPRSIATVGLYTVFSGDTARGTALVERSVALNARYPGWYLLAPFLAAYERADFAEALRIARRIGMPNFVAGHLAAAAAAGRTGTARDATPALEALARFDPRLVQPQGAREVWSDGAFTCRIRCRSRPAGGRTPSGGVTRSRASAGPAASTGFARTKRQTNGCGRRWPARRRASVT